MTSRTKLTVITALLFVSGIATAVAATLCLIVPVVTLKLFWYAFGSAVLTGVLLGTLLTNLAYIYGD